LDRIQAAVGAELVPEEVQAQGEVEVPAQEEVPSQEEARAQEEGQAEQQQWQQVAGL